LAGPAALLPQVRTRIVQEHANEARELGDAVANWSNDPRQGGLRQSADATIQKVFSRWEQGIFVSTDSPIGRHVITLFESQPVLALATLSAACQKIGGPQFEWYKDAHFGERFSEAIEGWIELALIERGLGDSRRDHLNSLEELRERYAEDAQKFASYLADATGRVDGLEQAARRYVSLRASRSYWGERMRTHSIAAIFAGIVLFAASFMLLSEGFKSVPLLLDNMAQLSKHLGLSSNADGSLMAKETSILLLLLGAGLLFVIWPLRVIHRVFTSHLTGYFTASERVTMVDTYIALTNEDRLLTQTDRALILAALFRTSPLTSVAGDDTPTMGLLDLLTSKLDSATKQSP
jgi:hypothetical protein